MPQRMVLDCSWKLCLDPTRSEMIIRLRRQASAEMSCAENGEDERQTPRASLGVKEKKHDQAKTTKAMKSASAIRTPTSKVLNEGRNKGA